VPLVVLLAVTIAAAAAQAFMASRGPFKRALMNMATPDPYGSSSAGAPRVKRVGSWLAACRHPAAAAALFLCVALLVSVLSWILVGGLAFLVRTYEPLRDLDSSVADWGSGHATEISTAALEAITLLGETHVAAGLAAVVLLAEAVRGLRLRVVVFLVAVIVGNNLITSLVKNLMDRARPELAPIAHTLGPSFPSGHSSTAAAFYAAAAVVLARRRSHAAFTLFTSLAVAIAVAVACTRVLLDVHWFSDVVAGLALGWAWLTLCAVVLGDELQTRGRSREQSDLRRERRADAHAGERTAASAPQT
jgi:membrane-associated phospholipid phosphatase